MTLKVLKLFGKRRVRQSLLCTGLSSSKGALCFPSHRLCLLEMRTVFWQQRTRTEATLQADSLWHNPSLISFSINRSCRTFALVDHLHQGAMEMQYTGEIPTSGLGQLVYIHLYLSQRLMVRIISWTLLSVNMTYEHLKIWCSCFFGVTSPGKKIYHLTIKKTGLSG